MPTSRPDNLEIVLVEFLGALSRGDRVALRAVFTADVLWRGLRDDWVCHGPADVVDTLLGGFAHVRPVDALEFLQAGDHVVMGVRSPRLDAIDDEPLAGQIYNVLTLQDGKISRIRDYRHRSEALAAAGAADPGWRSGAAGTEPGTTGESAQTAGGSMPPPDRDLSSIGTEEPVARAVVAAIHAGDIQAVRTILNEHPGLAAARLA